MRKKFSVCYADDDLEIAGIAYVLGYDYWGGAGMKWEAVLREHIKRKDGTWGDDLQYGLLRKGFSVV